MESCELTFPQETMVQLRFWRTGRSGVLRLEFGRLVGSKSNSLGLPWTIGNLVMFETLGRMGNISLAYNSQSEVL